MLYAHSWLLRRIGKACLLLVYCMCQTCLYYTECWSTQMFCILLPGKSLFDKLRDELSSSSMFRRAPFRNLTAVKPHNTVHWIQWFSLWLLLYYYYSSSCSRTEAMVLRRPYCFGEAPCLPKAYSTNIVGSRIECFIAQLSCLQTMLQDWTIIRG